MTDDIGFVIAAYAVILGGLATYTVTLWRRMGDRRDDQGR